MRRARDNLDLPGAIADWARAGGIAQAVCEQLSSNFGCYA
jgi:hypothetical protein